MGGALLCSWGQGLEIAVKTKLLNDASNLNCVTLIN